MRCTLTKSEGLMIWCTGCWNTGTLWDQKAGHFTQTEVTAKPYNGMTLTTLRLER